VESTRVRLRELADADSYRMGAWEQRLASWLEQLLELGRRSAPEDQPAGEKWAQRTAVADEHRPEQSSCERCPVTEVARLRRCLAYDATNRARSALDYTAHGTAANRRD
jgi:hypothetical protein